MAQPRLAGRTMMARSSAFLWLNRNATGRPETDLYLDRVTLHVLTELSLYIVGPRKAPGKSGPAVSPAVMRPALAPLLIGPDSKLLRHNCGRLGFRLGYILPCASR
jgi:hypothetical protein